MSNIHTSLDEFKENFEGLLLSPKDQGKLEMICQRPSQGEREVVSTGKLDLEQGLIGDNWKSRGSRLMADGSAHPDMQLNIMNSRVIALVARSRDRWSLAGDQLFVDLDLSRENLPPRTKLRVGDAVIEVTDQPHLGCKKFIARFGKDALSFVNAEEIRHLNLRGINAKVVEGGSIREGDTISKIS